MPKVLMCTALLPLYAFMAWKEKALFFFILPTNATSFQLQFHLSYCRYLELVSTKSSVSKIINRKDVLCEKNYDIQGLIQAKIRSVTSTKYLTGFPFVFSSL